MRNALHTAALRRGVSAAVIVAACAMAQGRAEAQSANIPLQLIPSSIDGSQTWYRLAINVGFGSSAPKTYSFDTGSVPFNAAYNAQWWPSSIDPNDDKKRIAPVSGLCYSSGMCFSGSVVSVPSISFYTSNTATTASYTLPTPKSGGYQVVAVTGSTGLEGGGDFSTLVKNGQPIIEGQFFGVFGAGNFVFPTGPGSPVLGSVLGQSSLAGTTAGYVVAANGQQVSTDTAVPPTQKQTVTTCSPCVILGLTPSLLAQFTTKVPWSQTQSARFPNSGAPSSTELGTTFNFSLSGVQKPIVWQGLTLLDTGTPTIGGFTAGGVSKPFAPGTTISIAGAVSGAAVSSISTVHPGPSHNIAYTLDVRDATAGDQTVGLPFFLQNSVLFDLDGKAIGYTSNFVTDVPIVTPLTVTSESVPLGLAGVISGPGGVSIGAGGSATLSAVNTYTGPTVVSAGGQLFVVGPGSIEHSSGLTVDAGGLVGGTGILPTTVINGILSPGSFGTITVKGNLTFGPSGMYVVELSPNAADHTHVTGTATLAGAVLAAFSTDTYKRVHYTILRAVGGLSGTFNTLIPVNVPLNFDAALSYTATDVVLDLTAHLGRDAKLPRHHESIANAISNFFNNSVTNITGTDASGGTLPANFQALFNLTGGDLVNALSLISGEAATGAQQGAFQLTRQFLDIMLDPFVDGRRGLGGTNMPGLPFAPEREALPDEVALAYAHVLKAPPKPQTFEQRWSVWGGAYGGTNRTTGDALVVGSHDLSARAAGFTAGLDYHLTRDTVIGFALAGGGTGWSLAQGLGGGKSDAFQAGIYGATRWGPAYVAGAFAFTNHWMSTDRFAFAGDHLTASFNAQSFGGRIEGGYRFGTMYGGIAPYAAIQAQSFRTPSYTETDLTNGGFGLSFNSRTAGDTRSELGARYDNAVRLDPYRMLAFRARLAWAHDWISDPTLAAVFQTLPGASFIVNGATPAKNSALTSAGAELRIANGLAFLAKFDGEFASHSSTYAGTGTVRYTW
jgi:uncharacterized protein with beta-barrel porin domain